jgi:hypothetical protein
MSDHRESAFGPAATAIIAELLTHRPEAASELGEHAHDDRLDDLSEAGLADYRRFLTRAQADLAALPAADTVDDAVDAEILRVGLARDAFALDELAETRWNPLVWLPGDPIHLLLTSETRPVADRLRGLAGRLAQVPDRLALAARTLADLPEVHVRTAIGQTGGTLALVRDEVPALLAAEPGLAGLVEPARAAAQRALAGYRDWLAEQVATAHGDPRLGPDKFAAEFPLSLDSGLTAAEVLARAEARIGEVRAELRAVVGGDDDAVRAALAAAGRDAPTDTTIVPLARTAYAEAAAAVRRLGLATVPDAPAVVTVMPEARRGRSVAYCHAPGALESGGTTEFAISPTPADWSAERVASFYREYNNAMIVNLAVHEAMPGHVLQLAHARRWRGSSPVRHVFASHTFKEGWAVHAERLMAEAGHGGPAVRLQQLKMALRTAVNTVLDAGVHAGGMTEAQAMDLMTGQAFQEEGEAVGKWRRAQLTSCQLSTYFTGYLELEPVLAGRDNVDPVLAHGSPPPRHLPALLAG